MRIRMWELDDLASKLYSELSKGFADVFSVMPACVESAKLREVLDGCIFVMLDFGQLERFHSQERHRPNEQSILWI